MILILTQAADLTADRVCRILEQRGEQFLRFDPADFPQRAELTVSIKRGGLRKVALIHHGVTSDLDQTTAVWCRRPGAPIVAEAHGELIARYLLAECKDFLRALYDLLDCPWVPGPFHVIDRMQLKLRQLQVAAQLGFSIPDTVVTNSPTALLQLWRERSHIVSKLAGPTAFNRTLGTEMARYTDVVNATDLIHAAALKLCPLTFQEHIEKAVEIRVTVVGDIVFSAEIRSQETWRTRVDWRRYDHASTRYALHDLPDSIADACRDLVGRLGLVYGAIDLIRRPDGEYVFLELNPAGEYGWIESRLGFRISEAICDLLTNSRHIEEASA